MPTEHDQALGLKRERERQFLKESIAVSVVLGVIAVGWGIAGESSVILFDGIFMLLGIALSGLSLLAAALASAEPTKHFPFDKQAWSPLVIAVQGAALLGALLFAALDAVMVIRGGGSEASAAIVLYYGVFTLLAAVAVTFRLSRGKESDLVVAEWAQWRARAALSAVIAAGGTAAFLLARIGWDWAVPFVDPVLVLIACALLVATPLVLLRSGLGEILEAAPPKHIQAVIDEAVAEVRSVFGLGEPFVGATKLGDLIYVDARFLVEESCSVGREDEVRRLFNQLLAATKLEVWANLDLTADETLAR